MANGRPQAAHAAMQQRQVQHVKTKLATLAVQRAVFDKQLPSLQAKTYILAPLTGLSSYQLDSNPAEPNTPAANMA
jgi:uncharacterized protein (DUF3084 family)